jgi:hypothetical protein
MTPFQRDGQRHGRKGSASLAGYRHGKRDDGERCGGIFYCYSGPVEVMGRTVEATYNECKRCGVLAMVDSEFARATGKRRRRKRYGK